MLSKPINLFSSSGIGKAKVYNISRLNFYDRFNNSATISARAKQSAKIIVDSFTIIWYF